MTPELERLGRILPRTKVVIGWFVDNRTRLNLVYPPEVALSLAETLKADPETIRSALRDLRPLLVRIPAVGGMEWWSLRGVSERESGELTLDVWAAAHRHRLASWCIDLLVAKRFMTTSAPIASLVVQASKGFIQVVTEDDAATVERMVAELINAGLLRPHDGWWRLFASREASTPIGDAP